MPDSKAVTDEITSILDAISRQLFVGSLNYRADFKLVKCDGIAGRALADILASALGEGVVIGGTNAVGAADVLDALRDALAHQGDSGFRPGQEYLSSDGFKRDESIVLARLGGLLEGANQIVSFWLKEGHPFYPVFWDFAFSIETGADAFVFIGSSSD